MPQAPCSPLRVPSGHLAHLAHLGHGTFHRLTTPTSKFRIKHPWGPCSTQQVWGPVRKPLLPCPWETNLWQIPRVLHDPCQASCTIIHGFLLPRDGPQCARNHLPGLLAGDPKDDTVSPSRTRKGTASPPACLLRSGLCPSPAAVTVRSAGARDRRHGHVSQEMG